ncbi:MAG: PhzF family phenazine biosynthesis protein [Bacilli bacterium]
MTDFYIVDVFTQGKYTGNQLAVFLDGGRFSSEQMQTLARETHFSETTFIMDRHPSADGSPRYSVRIFTPAAEIPFAGHPALGAAFVIAQTLVETPVSRIELALHAGVIPVDITYDQGKPDCLTMTQHQPAFGETIDHAAMAECLDVPETALDSGFPVQIVSTGLPFAIVAMRSLRDAQSSSVRPDALRRLTSRFPDLNILVFTTETALPQHDLHTRVFVPELGVSEDPATGSATGCLCAFLLRYGIPGEAIPRTTFSLKVEQGYQIKRPSLLLMTGERGHDHYDIRVGGRVEWVARGELLG